MGIFRNIALETAIKKALLDVTNNIEQMTRSEISFGNRVREYISYLPALADLETDTWEGSFTRMITVYAQNEMPSNKLIQNQNDLVMLSSLIAEWVTSKGGNATNVYREINYVSNINENSEVRPTKEINYNHPWYAGIGVFIIIILFKHCSG